MKRKITSLLVSIAILATPISANAISPLQYSSDLSILFQLDIIEQKPPLLVKPMEKDDKPAEPEKLEPVIYIVVPGDNLTKIGTEHNVTWQRLWAKNTQLKHPDIINVGDEITIPLAHEKLDREIPQSVTLPTITPGVVKTPQAGSGAATRYDNSNTYDYGYCTWYVKNKRGSTLPNGLGNANTWYARARTLGMAVGSTPRAGAVGTTTRGSLGHVVYVESINNDGTINISEMNYKGWGKTTHRTASASEFVYIY